MPMFLHLSLAHLALNLLGLYMFGPLLERAYGCGRFALVFLGGGVAGSLASMLFSRQLGVGASGGILGVCRALVFIRYRRPAMLPANAQAVCGPQLVAGVGLTLAFGWLVPGIDNWAHLGGLAGGAAVGLLLKPQSPASDLAFGLITASWPHLEWFASAGLRPSITTLDGGACWHWKLRAIGCLRQDSWRRRSCSSSTRNRLSQPTLGRTSN